MATQAATVRPGPRAFRLSRVAPKVALLAFILAVGYLTVWPLIRLQYLAFDDGFQTYRDAYSRPDAWKTVRWTVYLGVGSLAIALVLGTGLAWAASNLPRRMRWLRVLPILPIILPPVAAVLGWAFMLSPVPGYLNQLLRHLPWWSDRFDGPFDAYTLPWIIVITGLALASFVYLFVSAGLENINEELIEAAYVNGSSRAGVFFRVVLPLLRPALVYGAGVSLLLGLGQFTAPLLLGRQQGVNVITTDMYFQTQLIPPQYGVAAAIGSPLLVFGIFVLFVNRVLLGDHTRFITHGGKGGFRQSERGSWTAALAIGGYGLLATLLPIVALVLVSVSKFWTGSFDTSTWTLDSWRQVLDAPDVRDAIWNSVYLSVLAAAITLPIAYVTAHVLLRRREHRVSGPVLDFVVAMPLSIPAVIFGVGFLLTYTNEPFELYGTRWVIVLVYVTLMIPFATRMILSGLSALGESYVEAARVAGASALRAHLTILAPLLRPTIGAACALMFVLLTHEFAASLLVRAPDVQVMGTILYDYYENGGYPLVAVISLVMCVVTTAGVAVAVAIGGSEAFKRL
jgi:iron(III) transport system permease protein